MKKKYILIIVVVIIIGLLVVACVIHKHKKDHYIETQEKRIDLYFKYNLNHYSSMKVTSFKKTPMGGYIVDG
ncbi:lipoprotein%2C putative [Staphylococcus aureus]|nr:lipoprotein%2C putative [Staphylococcus aureus]